MRPFHGIPIVPATNGLEGGLGVAMYLGAPGVDDQAQIEFRRVRTMTNNWFVVGDAWTPGTAPFLGDVVAALVKSPTTQIALALDASYNETVFWVQLRTHQDGLENDTIWRPQRVSMDASGDLVPLLGGTGRITRCQKLDGGGVSVEFEFYPAPGAVPETFELSVVSGPTSPAAVSVAYLAGVNRYSATMSSLQMLASTDWK